MCPAVSCVASRVRQTPVERRRTYRPKCCENNYKDKGNSPKTLNDKNHQTSFQKFRQLISRVKSSNPRKEVASFPTLRCSSYWKGSLRVPLDYGRQLTYIRCYGLNSITTVLLQKWLWHWIIHKRWSANKQRNQNFYLHFYIILVSLY